MPDSGGPLTGPGHFPSHPDIMMHRVQPLPITLQPCFPIIPVGPGTKSPSTFMSGSSSGLCLLAPPGCWLPRALLHCTPCSLEQDPQPINEKVRYRSKCHLALALPKEDSGSRGGWCWEARALHGYDEEASAHHSPRRHGGQCGPLVYMQGTESRIAHLGQMAPGCVPMPPDLLQEPLL